MTHSYTNYYDCPDCQTTWSDTGDSQVNGECPKCGTQDIVPYAFTALLDDFDTQEHSDEPSEEITFEDDEDFEYEVGDAGPDTEYERDEINPGNPDDWGV